MEMIMKMEMIVKMEIRIFKKKIKMICQKKLHKKTKIRINKVQVMRIQILKNLKNRLNFRKELNNGKFNKKRKKKIK